MEDIKFYEINRDYINYIIPYAPHMFRNSKNGQKNARKYIGIVMQVNGLDYFVPLSSFKPKHERMKESMDFIKVLRYAVLNLNNMFPVPKTEREYVDFETVQDCKYKALLLAEYRYIKSIREKIRKNAVMLYKHKLENSNDTPLARRCNDFLLLEKVCAEYIEKNSKKELAKV